MLFLSRRNPWRRAVVAAALAVQASIAGLSAAVAAPAAPDFSLPRPEGAPVTLAHYAGRPLLLFFMTFECPFCRRIEPDVNRLYDQSHGRYAILGAVYHSPLDRFPAKRRELGLRFPLAAGTNALKRNYGVLTTPTFWLIDAAGRKEELIRGPESAPLLRAFLRRTPTPPVGIVELLANPATYLHKKIDVAGFVAADRFADGHPVSYVLTNSMQKVALLPVDANRLSPADLRSLRAMRGKPVEVHGRLQAVAGIYALRYDRLRILR